VADTPCALCGDPIKDNPDDPEDSLSREHVPPLQFYPKSMRSTLREALWQVPSHRKCNASYKKDEEYFYHRFYPLVGFQNEPMGQVMLDDIHRRAKKPQTPVLIRHMLQECKRATPGGILLPEGLIRVEYDLIRVQRVAVKIAQCLFYKDHQRFVSRKDCQHIELCESPTNLQAFFAHLCQTEMKTVEPAVFCYWHVELDGLHYYSMLFWGAFMFCMIFQDPKGAPG
jgi:hypothetical protein